ncbi:U-box domain-containing protein 12 [Selaginella moellendorffii]|nr:U-box domain-containing protein 12 [Selaginella moellendorffii]|eukprot:XP_002967806.2 U-box domain-containing protein 12 [Selaginella moellendorffii]
MPAKEYDPSALLNAKPGSCSPSPSHSRKVFESLSSMLDNFKYCRPKQDFQHSLVPLRSRRTDAWPRNSTSSSNSSTSTSTSSGKDEQKFHREAKARHRRSAELQHHYMLHPNSGYLFATPKFEKARSSQSTDESDEVLGDLQPVIEELGSSNSASRRHAAERVRRLAKSSTRISMTLVKMGAITPLIAMLDAFANDKGVQHTALLALLSLAIGTNVNKAAIVTAGAVPKMVKISQESGGTVQEGLAAVFLSLSALDVNKPVIGHSGAVPALINILKQGASLKAKKDALKALCNLSIFHGNVKVIVDANIIQSLLDMIYHPELVETAVDLLGNLAATEVGRRAIVDKQDAVLILVDVLGWADAPQCQEKAVSVLMTMAYRSRALRQAISRCGAVSALLELSILGSSLAQKVAAWILDCLKQDDDFGRKSSTTFHDVFCCEDAQPGKFVHKVLQNRNMMAREGMNPQLGPGCDISDHFISITL